MCNLTYFWQNNKNVIGYSTQSITFSLKARKRQFRQFLKYLTHCDVLWGREERQNSASTVSDCKASFLVVLYFDPLRITLQCFLGGPSLGPQSTWAPPCKTINHPSAWKTWDVAKKPINVTKSISIFFSQTLKLLPKLVCLQSRFGNSDKFGVSCESILIATSTYGSHIFLSGCRTWETKKPSRHLAFFWYSKHSSIPLFYETFSFMRKRKIGCSKFSPKKTLKNSKSVFLGRNEAEKIRAL